MKLAIAVDVIIHKNNEIVLVKRVNEPFKDYFALPGGMMKLNETLREAAEREALEETGLKVKIESLLGIYDEVNRDPRGRVISVCFVAKPVGGELKARSDVKEVRWFNLDKINFRLAFDHNKILKDYIKIEKGKRKYF
jgi:8-oxo-dGTP diphosphatase